MRYSEIQPGQTIDCGSRTITEEEMLAFAQRYDPQPMHTDSEFARASQWGELIASGWLTCSVAMELVTQAILLGSESIGSPGVDEIRWENPVHGGDELTVKVHVLQSRISSNGKYGVVRWRWEMHNQRKIRVLRLTCISLFKRDAVNEPARLERGQERK